MKNTPKHLLPRLPISIPETTIYYTPELRQLWPNPLADRWAAAYPCLFDADDLRITRKQPKYHFNEWFAAIHLFHRDGAVSLAEKYLFNNHARKKALIKEVLTTEQYTTLADILAEFQLQPPDLCVITPDRSRFWFAEVKGPGDRLTEVQKQSHLAIRQRLKVPIELILVRPGPPSASRAGDKAASKPSQMVPLQP
jgi:hypothetical protein